MAQTTAGSDNGGMGSEPGSLTWQGINILDVDECWALLRSNEVGRLAVSIANRPDIFPINYVVDGQTIVFRTAEGTKLAGAVLGIAVAFEIDGYDTASGETWSVVVKGGAVEIENMYELFDAQDLPLFPWNAAPKHRFVRIVPAEITGRRFVVTDKAAWHEPLVTDDSVE
jgi:nitroimidazol reductase NimA-like FMN-containing flavoprotein (pyridoxamine 5'-phosphate oxidase superfamily)